MAFNGFPREFFEFFTELKENNKREWFEDNKQRYEDSIVTPCLDFITAMGPELKKVSQHFEAIPKKVGGSMFRIYRDTRFSKDKTPYKTNAGLHFRHALGRDAHAPGFYLHLEPDQVFFGGGLWMPPSNALNKIREAIDKNQKEWKSAQSAKAFKARYGALGEGNPLTRPPKGYADDHPFIDDLKKRNFFAVTEAKAAAAGKPDFVKEVARAYKDTSPVAAFLCKAVGAPF